MIFSVGVLVFNPFDDIYHMERIRKTIDSLLRAKNIYETKSLGNSVNIYLLGNESLTHSGDIGLGQRTKALLEEYSRSTHVLYKSWSKSMNVKGYNILLKKMYNDGADYISVFADDYIVPIDWFSSVSKEFKENIDFVMPATTFVAQTKLLVPFSIKKNWKLNYRGDDLLGVTSGVQFEDVDSLARKCRFYPTIKYFPAPSFETTVFSRRFIDIKGFLCDDYYSLFYNHDFFHDLKKNALNGVISRKSFVFHHGKGGTNALYKKEGDEKFVGSPVESFLRSDVDLFNSRTSSNIEYWWESSTTPPHRKMPTGLSAFSLVIMYSAYSFWKSLCPK
ncbi:TPA: hypothetical protein ACRZZH_002295 [Vibrio harveyi]